MELILPMNKVFLDTSYAVALSAITDENHARAAELADELETSGTNFITTRAILLEIGNTLAKVRHRSPAITLLTALKMIQELKSWRRQMNSIDELSRPTVTESIRSGD